MKNCHDHPRLAGLFLVFLFLLVPLNSTALQKSYEFGNVILDRSVTEKGPGPVIFRHWIHRSKHTCRVCHVDIEFSMESGETGVTEADNKEGRYCGTCHNGKVSFALTECTNCHAKNQKDMKTKNSTAKSEFFKFQKNLPRSTYGNKIDWNEAEEKNLIVASDFIEGASFSDKKMANAVHDDLKSSSVKGLPGIIFSHEKHITWTGCGMCHPDPFALEHGKTKMSMKEITAGKYCGLCHGSVAFPINDCSKCHANPVK